MYYPFNIKTRKEKILYNFFRGLYAFEAGKGKVIGRFTGWWTEGALLFLILDKFGITPSLSQVIIALVVGVIVCTCMGVIYMKHQVDLIENQVGAERQPLMKAVYDEIIKSGGNKK